MEVVVDELWTRTVAKMPIIRPATGLLRMSFEAKASPAAFPPNRRKALLRKSNEQMNKYRRPRSRTIFVNAKATRRNFPNLSSSVVEQTERFGHSIISPVEGQGEGPGRPAALSKGLDDGPHPLWFDVIEAILWNCYIGIAKKILFWFALCISCRSLYVTLIFC